MLIASPQPSDDVAAAGVLVRLFDKIDDARSPWLPCPRSLWCAKFGDRFSATLVNAELPHLYNDWAGGMVLDTSVTPSAQQADESHPFNQKQSEAIRSNQKQADESHPFGANESAGTPTFGVLSCSYPGDGSTMKRLCDPPGQSAACTPGCGGRGTNSGPAWCDPTAGVEVNCAWRPTDLSGMMRHHQANMRRKHAADARLPSCFKCYNEVVLDSAAAARQLPDIVAAFFVQVPSIDCHWIVPLIACDCRLPPASPPSQCKFRQLIALDCQTGFISGAAHPHVHVYVHVAAHPHVSPRTPGHARG